MEILDYFKLPEKAQITQRVYTKDVIAALDATGSDKALIEKSISTIHLVGILNETTTGLWAYRDNTYLYEEVQLFLIALKDATRVKQLNENIQKVFPNPIIVIYKNVNEYMLSTAMKRLNKVEKGKAVIDSIQTSGWFKLDSLHDELLSKINYQKKNIKEFYESIDYLISAEYVAKITGKVPESIDFMIKTKSLAIQQLLEEKNKWILQEQEETSMQGKMQCHIKIKEINQKIENLSE